MKRIVWVLVTTIIFCSSALAQRSSNTAGAWSTAANWTPNGTPASNEAVTVNHAMTGNPTVSITAGGNYVYNASNTSTNTLSISGGTLEVKNNSTVSFTNSGTYNLSGGSIIVRSGSTLNIGNGTATINLSGVSITVESGATLNLKGNVTRSNTASITVNGTLNTEKTFSNTATGTITVNGTMNVGTTNTSTNTALESRATSFTIDGTGSLVGTGKLLMRDVSNISIDLKTSSTSFSGNLENFNSNPPTINTYNSVYFGGYNLTNNGIVYVRTGATLTFFSSPAPACSSTSPKLTTNANGLKFYIEPDANMVVNGDMEMQNGGTLQIDGQLRVNGDFRGQDTHVTGSGEFTTACSMVTTNNYQIFGNNFTSNPCSGPECDGRRRCGRSGSISSSAGASVCSGNSSTLTVSYTPSTYTTQSFQWESRVYGGVYSSISGATNTTYVASPTVTTYYRVKITVNGCTFYSATSTLSITSAPTAPTGATGTTTICSGNSTDLTATGGSGSSYRWYTAASGGTLLSSSTVYSTGNLSSTTTYYIASVSGSCESTTRYSVTVTVNATPTTPTAGSNSPVYEEGTINLTAAATTPVSTFYSWSGPNSYTSSSQNPSITNATLAMSGTYTVTATTASGCFNTSTVVVTVNPLTFTWTGNTNSVWNNTGNWSSGIVPTSTRAVTIPSGRPNYPILISESGDVNVLAIQSGAKVTLGNNGNLTVRGDLSNSGTFTGLDGSRLYLSGGSNGTITGYVKVKNLTMNKTAGFSATLTSTLDASGAIDLTSGTLQSNGYFVLSLDSGYINGGGSGSVGGLMTMTRTVSVIKTHYFSVPMDGVAMSDLADDAQVFASNGQSRLFTYNESTNTWSRITSLGTFVRGTPYSMYFTAPTVVDFTGTYTHGYVHNVTFTNTSPTPAWKYVGNPYPSALDWKAVSGWTQTNLINSITFWDAASASYVTYNGATDNGTGNATRYIPALNVFAVQTTGTGGATSTLSMTSSTQASVLANFHRSIDLSNVYSMKVSNGTVSDEMLLIFNDAAGMLFEPEVDAYKQMNSGSVPNIATTLEGKEYVINTINVPIDTTEIAMYFKANTSGNFNLTWTNRANPLNGKVYLLDKKYGTSEELVDGNTYPIVYSTSDTVRRYALKFVMDAPTMPSLTTGTTTAQAGAFMVYYSNGMVYIQGKSGDAQQISGDIITLQGVKLDHFEGVVSDQTRIERQVSGVAKGVYMAVINQNGKPTTCKFVVE